MTRINQPVRFTSLRALLAGLALTLCATLALPACDTTYTFDGLDVGEYDDDDAEPRTRSNSQFIRSLYADVLGRAPEVYDFVVTFDGAEAFRIPIDEQDFLVDVLDGVGDPTPIRALITAGVVHSDEVDIPNKADVADPAEYITEQFRKFLGRNPGVYELDAFVREWESDPAVNPRTVIRALIGSREYQSF